MTYTKPVAIFSIDNVADFTTLKKFMKHLDSLWALGHLNYKPRKCIGLWDGFMEDSFVMDLEDFFKYARSWCVEQEAILEVHPKSPRQPHIKMGYLNFIKYDYVPTSLEGEFVKVDPQELAQGEPYTYFTDTMEYWTVQ